MDKAEQSLASAESHQEGASVSPTEREERPAGGREFLQRRQGGDTGQIGLAPKEAAAALDELRRLCASPTAEAQALDGLVGLLREAGYREEMTRVLVEALSRPEVNPHVGALWMHRFVTSHSWNRSYPKAMDDLCQRGEAGRQAVITFLEHTGRKGRSKLVRQAVRKHGEWLREHPQGRSVAARALLDAGCYGKVLHWTRNWRRTLEPDLQGLHCRASALRARGKCRQAREVAQFALSRPGASEQFPVLNLWCAVEEALAGDTEAAWSHFKRIKPAGWDEDALSLYYLTRGVIRVQQAERASRKEAFRSASRRIEDWFHGGRIYRRGFLVRRYYRRCLWRMAMDSGRWTRGFWAAWRSADAWLVLAALLVIPPLQLLMPTYLFRFFRRRHARSAR